VNCYIFDYDGTTHILDKRNGMLLKLFQSRKKDTGYRGFFGSENPTPTLNCESWDGSSWQLTNDHFYGAFYELEDAGELETFPNFCGYSPSGEIAPSEPLRTFWETKKRLLVPFHSPLFPLRLDTKISS
jgi:hypothetical protein